MRILSYTRPVWQYRHFVAAAIRGDFKARVARSRIGALWFVLHPLAMALIYVLILSEVLQAKLGMSDKPGAYAVYLLAGIAVWSLYSEIINRCMTMFIDFANSLKKISFPRACLPFIVVGSALITHALLLLAIAVIIVFYGFTPTFSWLLLVIPLLVTVLLATGLGVTLGVLNVFSRDVSQVMLVVMNMWFWLTPIVYASDMLPEPMQRIIALNPATALVQGYQKIILLDQAPDLMALSYPALLGVVLTGLSLFLFRRAGPELVDVL